jgi:transcriptional regulator with XRE-family HTH domain
VSQDFVSLAVRYAVHLALKTRAWDEAELADRLGLSEAELQAWADGSAGDYDLRTAVKLFNLADLSMDEAFALGGRVRNTELTRQMRRLVEHRIEDALEARPSAKERAFNRAGCIDFRHPGDPVPRRREELPDYYLDRAYSGLPEEAQRLLSKIAGRSFDELLER